MLRPLKNIKYFICIKKSGQFSNEWYLRNNPDVNEVFQNSFWHKLDLKRIPVISKFAKYMAHPLRHYIKHGSIEHRKPTIFFDADAYCSKYSDVDAKVIDPFYHYLKYGIKEGRICDFNTHDFSTNTHIIPQQKTVFARPSELLVQNFRDLQPIQFFMSRDSQFLPRLNFITDALGKSLLGGVGTALILASQYATKNNLILRLITRHSPTNLSDYFGFMKMMDEPVPKMVECWSDYDRGTAGEYNYRLEISPKDEFFTTSWWTTAAVKSMNLKNKIFYIIQEVEPFFYPYGDEHLWCSWQMNLSEVCYIVNSRWLWDYLSKYYPNVCRNGTYFEPAFPKHLYAPGSSKNKSKRNLFFYARESNKRNLYYTGLSVLDEAFQRGILKPEDWNIFFAGNSTQCIEFSNGTRASTLGQMSWNDYSKFLKTVDLTFSLMYTPHPSYPPLDTIASGGVCVTNSFENKNGNLFCENVIFGDLTIDGLCVALQKGIQLVADEKQRERNYQNSSLPTSWAKSFKKTIKFMEDF